MHKPHQPYSSSISPNTLEVRGFTATLQKRFLLNTRLVIHNDPDKRSALDFTHADARVQQQPTSFVPSKPSAVIFEGSSVTSSFFSSKGKILQNGLASPLGIVFARRHGWNGSLYYAINPVTFRADGVLQGKKESLQMISAATENCLACVSELNKSGGQICTIAMPVLGRQGDGLSMAEKSRAMAASMLEFFRKEFTSRFVPQISSIVLFAREAAQSEMQGISSAIEGILR